MTKPAATIHGDKTLSPFPYKPSWLNLLIRWIDRLPGSPWIYYLVGAILLGLIINIGYWLTGEASAGAIDLSGFAYGLYPFYFVALMHYLDEQARIALRSSKPLLNLNDRKLEKIEYELTVVPAAAGWITLFIAIPLTLLDLFSSTITMQDFSINFLTPLIASVVSLFTGAAFVLFCYHTVRQLYMVSRILGMTSRLSVFQSQPLYAMSKLTSRTGMGLIVFGSLIIAQDPPDPSQPVYIMFIFILFLVAIAAFILPILGIHSRLLIEKQRQELQLDNDLDLLYKQYHNLIQAGDYAGLDGLNKALNTVLGYRGVISKYSTWPWQTDTVRGFFTTMLLPVIIYILSRTLGKFLSL